MDAIHLTPYTPAWPAMYAAEAARLRAALASADILDMQHFGSTAIPGLAAKPVIDILIAVPDLTAARARFPDALAPRGYAFWADNPKPDRLFFVRGLPPNGPRSHHVHVTRTDGEMWARLAFRDYLIAHPDEAAAYGALKHDLAARYADDREAYTDGKAAFVTRIMALATEAGRGAG